MIYRKHQGMNQFTLMGILLCVGIGLTSLAWAGQATVTPVGSGESQKAQVGTSDSHRVIKGIVEEITEDQVKVNAGEVGEMNPRYIPLNIAQEKEFSLKKGDKVEIVLNAQNLVVDYRLVNHGD